MITLNPETHMSALREDSATRVGKEATGDFIETAVYYLIKDPKHKTEKPYELRYNARGAIPQTNTKNESKPIVVRNFRPLQNARSFEEFGFCTGTIDCALGATDFSSEENIRDVYYSAVDRLLRKTFSGIAGIVVLEHGLRQRDEKYRPNTEDKFKKSQPASIAHIDFTPYSCDRISHAFKSAPKQWSRVLAVNIWKPLNSGNDWPLALCDGRTIDRSEDTITSDVVHHNRFVENQRLYYSHEHEWYYFKDLNHDEVIMFRQSDSAIEGGGGVPHSGVYNPCADLNAKPRESIELRAFVFFE